MNKILKMIYAHSQTQGSGSTSYIDSSSFIKRHAGLELAVFFIIIGVLAVATGTSQQANKHSTSNPHSSSYKSANTVLELSNAANSAGSNDPTTSNNSGSQSNASSISIGGTSGSVSTNVSNSTNSMSSTSTNVTVNGQTIDVPPNGSTQQSVNTPGGSATINVTHNQTSDSNSVNSSVTSTALNSNSNISINSTSSSSSEDN